MTVIMESAKICIASCWHYLLWWECGGSTLALISFLQQQNAYTQPREDGNRMMEWGHCQIEIAQKISVLSSPPCTFPSTHTQTHTHALANNGSFDASQVKWNDSSAEVLITFVIKIFRQEKAISLRKILGNLLMGLRYFICMSILYMLSTYRTPKVTFQYSNAIWHLMV